MERQEHIDYAAVVRAYHASGTRLSMREWCQKEGYDYEKVRKYNQKKYILPELNPQTPDSPPTPGFIDLKIVDDNSAPSQQEALTVIDITVTLSNGLELHLHNRTIEDMSRIVHKIIS